MTAIQWLEVLMPVMHAISEASRSRRLRGLIWARKDLQAAAADMSHP